MKTIDDGSRILIAERLGKVQSVTPEGYLLCEGVPVARTGLLIYVEGELIGNDGALIKGGKDGIIRVTRSEDELFRPEAMFSFNGKPITDGHPEEMADPENWSDYAKGVMLNVRRGSGLEDDCLLADLLITDAEAIADVRDGKRQVSLGYDADYPQEKPGEARQTNIIGNHIALTDNGRCGPRCAIGDENMTKPKFDWRKLARFAFATKDEAAFEKAMEEADKPADGAEARKDGESAVHVHIHNGVPEKPKEAESADEGEKPEGEAAADPLAAIMEMLKKFDERLTAIEQSVAKNAEAESAKTEGKTEDDNADLGTAETGEDDTVTMDDEPLEIADDKEKEDVGKKGTMDAAPVIAEIIDVKARAEILVPGVRFPTFDAKDGKIGDKLGGFRRKVLKHAISTEVGAKIVNPILAGSDLKAMTFDAVKVAFNAASEAMRAHNNGANRQPPKAETPASITNSALSAFNKKAAEFWAKN